MNGATSGLITKITIWSISAAPSHIANPTTTYAFRMRRFSRDKKLTPSYYESGKTQTDTANKAQWQILIKKLKPSVIHLRNNLIINRRENSGFEILVV
ncbi:hypothetical protein Zmor_010800 [Zophobas morio]|uniref:Uncharacterized protein n=1 Tax=Zophobas morio TaxID=2755281 RepID=A0AA38MKA0_9CUCU|nr:hypothetical protein Zmor_010800 [Zophobas morio]